MLLFNENGKNIRGTGHNFNTSNVTIQRIYFPGEYTKYQNFNTSNVTIQRRKVN